MPRSAKPSVVIIGTGRLGSALALALQRSGYQIVGLVARHLPKAEAAARMLRLVENRSGKTAPPQVLAAKDLQRIPSSDILLISTPDDEIERLARQLARHVEKRTVLHTSGALSSAVLAPLARRGFSTGSLHPLVSVSEAKAGADAFAGAFFCVEGDAQAMLVARRIVRDLKGSAFSIPTAKKVLYHAAAVMASPHTTALFDVAVKTLVAAGLERKVARRVLMPLLESTVQNLKTSDPADALTGTFARGDIATVKRHLKALSGKEQRQILHVYRLLGLHSLELSSRKGLDAKTIKAIRKLLK